jgi:hypothetical protein
MWLRGAVIWTCFDLMDLKGVYNEKQGTSGRRLWLIISPVHWRSSMFYYFFYYLTYFCFSLSTCRRITVSIGFAPIILGLWSILRQKAMHAKKAKNLRNIISKLQFGPHGLLAPPGALLNQYIGACRDQFWLFQSFRLSCHSGSHVVSAFWTTDWSFPFDLVTVFTSCSGHWRLTINVPVVYMVRYKMVLRGDYP